MGSKRRSLPLMLVIAQSSAALLPAPSHTFDDATRTEVEQYIQRLYDRVIRSHALHVASIDDPTMAILSIVEDGSLVELSPNHPVPAIRVNLEQARALLPARLELLLGPGEGAERLVETIAATLLGLVEFEDGFNIDEVVEFSEDDEDDEGEDDEGEDDEDDEDEDDEDEDDEGEDDEGEDDEDDEGEDDEGEDDEDDEGEDDEDDEDDE